LPLYKRKFPCAVCGKPVYWDSDKQILSCGCGDFKATFVNLDQYERLPKYARHIWKSEEIPIDSISFLANGLMHISDQCNNEDPRMVMSFINYPRERRTQLRLAFSGKFHVERPTYYRIDPVYWKERCWIIIPIEQIERIIQFLQAKNPLKLENWM